MSNTSQQEKRIDIVVTSYNRPKFTAQCLESIAETTHPHRVILIDNCSDQETQDYLWDAREAGLIDILILLDKNIGLEPAKNRTLSFIESELYVDTDNDIIATDKDWLTKLIKLMDEHKNYAAIASRPQIFVGDDIELLKNNEEEVREYRKCGASMRIMRTDLVKEVGGWRGNPKNMHEANRGEEFYICGKLQEKGFKVGYSRDIECKHLFGEDNWGYPEDVEHYHQPVWPIPTDKLYG